MTNTRSNIYRLTWSHATGAHWLYMRTVEADNADAWLNVYRSDEPNAVYKAAPKTPKLPDDAATKALHVASFA